MFGNHDSLYVMSMSLFINVVLTFKYLGISKIVLLLNSTVAQNMHCLIQSFGIYSDVFYSSIYDFLPENNECVLLNLWVQCSINVNLVMSFVLYFFFKKFV